MRSEIVCDGEAGTMRDRVRQQGQAIRDCESGMGETITDGHPSQQETFRDRERWQEMPSLSVMGERTTHSQTVIDGRAKASKIMSSEQGDHQRPWQDRVLGRQ